MSAAQTLVDEALAATGGVVPGRHSAVALAAMRAAPAEFRAKVEALLRRHARQSLPSPGGSVQRFSVWTKLPDGCDVTLVKPHKAQGTDVEIVVGTIKATLSGNALRILGRTLPDVVTASCAGQMVGSVVDLSGQGGLAALADATILSSAHDNWNQLLLLDLPEARITLDDVARGVDA